MTVYASTKPAALEKQYGGSYLYHWDINEVETVNEEGNVQTQYEYQEVRVYAPLTRAKIVKAVITSLWDEDEEQKLVNDYNACACGVSEDSTAFEAYKEFLTERERVRAQVHADCEEEGIN